MIFRPGAAANKINGRLAKSIQEVGLLNKHIVSKIIHTPIVYRAGNCRSAPLCPPSPPPPSTPATPSGLMHFYADVKRSNLAGRRACCVFPSHLAIDRLQIHL